ncbi:MAG: pyruvate dehydrogenase (acetyl-transferring), homodimeric type [Acidobacteria bacterium]|nr:pyruvate dehydrogenase (acetyl-transferring), homodimeric type [Acidobacteriota bacterium]
MTERPKSVPDIDPQETLEWLESLDAVVARDGTERAEFLLSQVGLRARERGVADAHLPAPYVNSISPAAQPDYPGDLDLEWRIAAHARWNAMAMVVRANRASAELGGHISTFASAATLYEVGFNHFFQAPHDGHAGDLLYVQGHSSPGIYGRAFLEGRLDESQLERFRREVEPGGISSYPHPWLMNDFWQFATVSMGLGPLMAIYQARFMKYLGKRGLIDPSDRRVWAFLGDGEMDEPESLGALTVAAREGLGNLTFVVNCNLQRLDGPVRGNASIVRELESLFRGAGWNVIKVLWGTQWDEWLAGPQGNLLRQRMEDAVDGDYQAYAADSSGTLIREHFFGRHPELLKLVEHMSDSELAQLPMGRGGHDPRKIYAAYAAAAADGRPSVILAKTIKGHGLGEVAQARNATHQQKKLPSEGIAGYRDWLGLDIPDSEVDALPFLRPAADSPEAKYLNDRREALGGSLPVRKVTAEALPVPPVDTFKAQLDGSGEREISTTMAFGRVLSTLLRDDDLKERVVPILADEARTFGMEGLFRQIGIYAPHGQLYTPVDRDQLAYYREDEAGQILQEGISEGGAFASWTAAATAYANHGIQMLPFYIYYSMFGLQRIGDMAWAAADMQARGFLLGATSGRTTLAGEGLQHQDGHSHLLASTIPNCRAYDPTYAYELAVIIQDGLDAMLRRDEGVFYYLTVMNENYAHPAMPEGAAEGILRGMHPLRSDRKAAIQLMGSGAILREVEAAADILAEDYDIAADVWSATSFTELRREAMAVRRWNRLHPTRKAKVPWVAQQFEGRQGPIVAATDYMEAVPEQIRPFLDRRFAVLGTDGFGRSDTRAQLRSFFEVDRRHIAVAALHALAEEGVVKAKVVSDAIKRYGIDPDLPDPTTV